jgi:hypothetical protein
MPNFCPNRGWSLAKPEPVSPYLCPRCGTDVMPVGPNPMPNFCATCGFGLGSLQSGGNQPQARGRGGSGGAAWFARIALLLILVIGALWYLNNTHEGLAIKCHVFGDWGACLLAS